jgi:SAM-dependent methyltransferase
VYAEQMMSKYNYIKEHGVDPVQLLEGLSNPARLIVEDGHHRLIIAHSMGIDVEATTIPATRGLVAEWNTHKRNNDGMHLYQSVFVNRQSIVSGQRDDALARMDSVHPSDLKGKSVLVLGCNNGHDCFMAGERGATRILGVDFDKLLLNYALRVATCYGYPTDFIHHDLRNPLDVGRFDTVLCFSVYDSVGSALLMPTLLNAGGVVYFEGHMLNKPILSDQEYRAHYQDILCHFGTVSLTYETACKSRRIYRLENL